MRASVYSNQSLIGYADLQPGDRAMGGIYGEFIPAIEYYSQVQPIVWQSGISASPDYAKWQALVLNAQLENGYFLFPTGGYEITDSPDFPHESKRIYLAGVAAEIIEDFIDIDPPRTFVEEPWLPLTIREKLALEAELWRELGPTPQKTRFSALCRFGVSDDILFSYCNSSDLNSHFALVHLTWSGTNEANPVFPRMTFFNSFAEFKLERMYPDRTEWES